MSYGLGLNDTFQPMLAYQETPETPKDIARLKFPMYFSTKIDGIRMTDNYGKVVSRTNKTFPSSYVNKNFSLSWLAGVDGEAVAGPPNSPTVFSDAYSAMMTGNCMTPVTWHVFDFCHPDHYLKSYAWRLDRLRETVEHHNLTVMSHAKIIVVEQKIVRSWEEVLEEEAKVIEQGYEGGMIRSPIRPYKFGRSTLIENGLIKIKRFETCEAIIEGFYELERNTNEAFTDGTGHTKRSSHNSGMLRAGTLGGLHVRDLESGVRFNLGSGLGLDAALRQHIWDNQPKYLGQIVSYKKLKVGEKDKPRNCTFRGFRSKIDI